MNVILKAEESTMGPSMMTRDMLEFEECINHIEVEDICSSGMQFTWTQKMLKPSTCILKKLDRVMVNGEFITKFSDTNAIFMPNLVSDHCPAIVRFHEHYTRKPKPFRFTNYIVEKPGFLETVKKGWSIGGEAIDLGQCMGKLKRLKQSMKQLNWKNGDLFEKVKTLKIELKNIQQLIDKQPFNAELRSKGVILLEHFNEAVKDEENFLYQKARIDWLRNGDRNSAFFHKTIKGRLHKSRIQKICNDKGESFEGEDVAKQFVEHFKKFLGSSYHVQEIRGTKQFISQKGE